MKAMQPAGTRLRAASTALVAVVLMCAATACGPSSDPDERPAAATATVTTPRSTSPSDPSIDPTTSAAPTSSPTPSETIPPQPDSQPKPVSVVVPAIDIDEPLIELGVQPDGTAEVPTDYADAGWLSTSGRPGAIGPTVLLGHVDSVAGPAVFYRLKDLEPGDQVMIGLASGKSATYQVTTVEQFPKDEFPTFAVYGATLTDVLRLVTCGGAFDQGASSYLDNIVVTATRVTEAG